MTQHRHHGQHPDSAPPAEADAHHRPLSQVEPGTHVRLHRIDGGRGLQARLAAMGLVPGVPLQVIRNGASGPCLVAVRDSRVMIGQGMAQRVFVR